MSKTKKPENLNRAQLALVKGGVVPVVLEKTTPETMRASLDDADLAIPTPSRTP